MTRRVAIVDGYSTGAALAGRLRALGVASLHVPSTASPGEHFAHSFRPQDYEDDLGVFDSVERAATTLRAAGVERVVAGTESGVELADRLAAAVGVPGNTLDGIPARRDKAAMADAVRRAGLRVPCGRTVHSPEQALEWARTSPAGTGWVAKPLRSAGSDHVTLCADADELADACARILASRTIYDEPNTAVLVQEWLRGEEFYVNTVSEGGMHRVVEMWTYVKRTGAYGAPLYDFEEPVPFGSPAFVELSAFVTAVLDAVGVSSSAAHTEVLRTADGPALVEVGARLGGGTDPAVVERFCGASQLAQLSEAIADPARFRRETPAPWGTDTGLRNVALINHRPGPAGRRWAERLRTLPSLCSLSASVAPGEWLGETTNLLDSPGYLYLAADRCAVERDYARLREWERDGLYTAPCA